MRGAPGGESSAQCGLEGVCSPCLHEVSERDLGKAALGRWGFRVQAPPACPASLGDSATYVPALLGDRTGPCAPGEEWRPGAFGELGGAAR